MVLVAEHMAHHRFLLADDDFNFEVASKQVSVCQFIGMGQSREWLAAEWLVAFAHSPPDPSGYMHTESDSDSYQIVGAELGA